MKYFCNPINIPYKYQFINDNGKLSVNREAADPSMILFKGKYYLFPSMTNGFFVSADLVDWSFHELKGVPTYDYAPDVRVVGEYIYFSASVMTENGNFYRTKDPIQGDFEMIEGKFPFHDPNLFVDDDGRMYFYWGCSNVEPIFGIELNPEDMSPLGDPIGLVRENRAAIGYERNGENHTLPSPNFEEIEAKVQYYTSSIPDVTEEMRDRIRTILGGELPFIEGAWMTKHKGKYYLQYSSPGTEHNIYSDGVYVSDNPLGPFTLAKNNPYSYKPGGFMPGAGHGSTMEDVNGRYWKTATMRISVNHNFERRLGIWPAGFDAEGELFCNQRFGDWPMNIDQAAMNLWTRPEWMLLSCGKPASASTYEEGKEAAKATEENVQTWWRAASNESGQWLQVDLQHECDVHAIQINFADDQLEFSIPEGTDLKGHAPALRYIEERPHYTRWLLEGSLDGKEYFVIEDKTEAETDLPHDLVVKESGIKARYIRCTVKELPYNPKPAISGLRVFGFGQGELPLPAANVHSELVSELDLTVSWETEKVVGSNVLWGFEPDKLYHSHMVFDNNEVTIKALVKNQPVYLRVDTFNEIGITEGEVFRAV